jgi:hypothetical protein
MILPAACTYIATNLMIILARSQKPDARCQKLVASCQKLVARNAIHTIKKK